LHLHKKDSGWHRTFGASQSPSLLPLLKGMPNGKMQSFADFVFLPLLSLREILKIF
jgi:hypothetical protein